MGPLVGETPKSEKYQVPDIMICSTFGEVAAQTCNTSHIDTNPGECAPIIEKIEGHHEHYSRYPYNGGQWGLLPLTSILADPIDYHYRGTRSNHLSN